MNRDFKNVRLAKGKRVERDVHRVKPDQFILTNAMIAPAQSYRLSE
jgi:hypothetical protein